MKTDILNTLSRSVHKAGFAVKKHSPLILTVVGTVGAVAGTVMACKATLKVNDILDESKETIEKIHKAKEDPKHPSYDAEAAKKDLTIVYVQTGVKLVKLYAPAIATGTLSLASILMSHRILNKRNAALAAAYTTVNTAFKDYRGRVIERFGETIDNELKHNIRVKEIEEITTDEKGNETTTKKQVRMCDVSEYADYYGEYIVDEKGNYVRNTTWQPSNEHNIIFLTQMQRRWNDKLKSRGYVTLNEVRESIGFRVARKKDGLVLGWVYDEHADAVGDNYIDFGIHRDPESYTAYKDGVEELFLLDFNVDGNIYDLM